MRCSAAKKVARQEPRLLDLTEENEQKEKTEEARRRGEISPSRGSLEPIAVEGQLVFFSILECKRF